MSDWARDQHQQAVAYATAELEGLQHFLAAGQEKAGQVVGAVYNAVGSQDTTDAGRNALEYTAAVQNEIPELIAKLRVAIEELRRYAGGF